MTQGTATGSARSRKRPSRLPIGNILDKDPPQLEDSLPLVLRPNGRCLVIVYGRDHLGDSAKVSAGGMSAQLKGHRNRLTIHSRKRTNTPVPEPLGTPCRDADYRTWYSTRSHA